MRCLSCQQEVVATSAKLVLQVYLCSGCGTMAEKAVKELELESARALENAKHVLAQHVMRGGLLLPRNNPEPVEPDDGCGQLVTPATFQHLKEGGTVEHDVQVVVNPRKLKP